MQIEQIDHVNLVVEDLLQMTAFYRDTLGLRQTRDATIAGDWIDAVTGLEGVELLSDIERVPTAQVACGGRQKRIVYCRDPEGNLLEWCDYQ